MSSCREAEGYSRCAMRQEHLIIFLQSASSEGSLCQDYIISSSFPLHKIDWGAEEKGRFK